MSNVKPSELTPQLTSLADTDLIIVSQDAGGGNYNSRTAPYSVVKNRYRTLFVPSSQIIPRSDSGAIPGVYESSTYKVHFETLDFDPDVIQYGQFHMIMDEAWDRSTVKVKFAWTTDTGTGNVIWGIQAQALTDSDPIDATFGTAVTVTDALTTLLDWQCTGATGAMTVAATPALGDDIVFQVYRNATDGSDTFTGNARLIGVWIQYNTTGIPSAW